HHPSSPGQCRSARSGSLPRDTTGRMTPWWTRVRRARSHWTTTHTGASTASRASASDTPVAPYQRWQLLIPFFMHLRFVVCADDHEFEQLLTWLAHVVQRPHYKTRLCQVLQGAQGTGKSLIFKHLVHALGEWGVIVPRMSDFAGEWTSVVQSRGLVVID